MNKSLTELFSITCRIPLHETGMILIEVPRSGLILRNIRTKWHLICISALVLTSKEAMASQLQSINIASKPDQLAQRNSSLKLRSIRETASFKFTPSTVPGAVLDDTGKLVICTSDGKLFRLESGEAVKIATIDLPIIGNEPATVAAPLLKIQRKSGSDEILIVDQHGNFYCYTFDGVLTYSGTAQEGPATFISDPLCSDGKIFYVSRSGFPFEFVESEPTLKRVAQGKAAGMPAPTHAQRCAVLLTKPQNVLLYCSKIPSDLANGVWEHQLEIAPIGQVMRQQKFPVSKKDEEYPFPPVKVEINGDQTALFLSTQGRVLAADWRGLIDVHSFRLPCVPVTPIMMVSNDPSRLFVLGKQKSGTQAIVFFSPTGTITSQAVIRDWNDTPLTVKPSLDGSMLTMYEDDGRWLAIVGFEDNTIRIVDILDSRVVCTPFKLNNELKCPPLIVGKNTFLACERKWAITVNSQNPSGSSFAHLLKIDQ